MDVVPTAFIRPREFSTSREIRTASLRNTRAAIQLDPDLAGAFQGIGAVYLDQHEWKHAEEVLERAAQLDSGNSQSEYWMDRLLLAQ